jgi:hypothetical protein
MHSIYFIIIFISFYWHVHFYSSLKAVFGLAFKVLVRMFWLNFWSIGWSISLQELYIRRIYKFTAEVGTYSSAKNPPKGWGFELGTYPGACRQCGMTMSHTSVNSSSVNSLKVLLKLSYLDIFEPMCEISAILIIWHLTGHLVYTYKYIYTSSWSWEVEKDVLLGPLCGPFTKDPEIPMNKFRNSITTAGFPEKRRGCERNLRGIKTVKP